MLLSRHSLTTLSLTLARALTISVPISLETPPQLHDAVSFSMLLLFSSWPPSPYLAFFCFAPYRVASIKQTPICCFQEPPYSIDSQTLKGAGKSFAKSRLTSQESSCCRSTIIGDSSGVYTPEDKLGSGRGGERRHLDVFDCFCSQQPMEEQS